MGRHVRVGIVGDYRAGHKTHEATDAALADAADARKLTLQFRWVGTPEVAESGDRALKDFDGVFVAPGSPYDDIDGAIEAIRFARENEVPLVGTCAGFQHVVIEYARNVAGIERAGHAEYGPDGAEEIVTPLDCSLVGQALTVRLEEASRIRGVYGADEATEEYMCSFGLNPRYRDPLQRAGLRISGVDPDGEPRVVELPDHPFFVATLYVPQLLSRPDAPHPLITAFLEACAGHRD